MNMNAKLYLFAGGRGKTIGSTFADVRNLIRGMETTVPRIAYVGAASMKDNRLIYAVIALLIKKGCRCRIDRVALASRRANIDRARKLLQNADVVFMSGGDVEAGMRVLEDRSLVAFLRELAQSGKPFFGVSAGSIMMSKGWIRWRDPQDDSTAELFPCLNLVPVYCDTHAEKDDWAELKAALTLDGAGTPGYGISSGAHVKAYPDGRLEAGSGPAACFRFQRGEVVRGADLIPSP
jgi:peptidase E